MLQVLSRKFCSQQKSINSSTDDFRPYDLRQVHIGKRCLPPRDYHWTFVQSGIKKIMWRYLGVSIRGEDFVKGKLLRKAAPFRQQGSDLGGTWGFDHGTNPLPPFPFISILLPSQIQVRGSVVLNRPDLFSNCVSTNQPHDQATRPVRAILEVRLYTQSVRTDCRV